MITGGASTTKGKLDDVTPELIFSLNLATGEKDARTTTWRFLYYKFDRLNNLNQPFLLEACLLAPLNVLAVL